MNIQLPARIAASINTLVEDGTFPSPQEAVESLLSSALARRTNKTIDRFAYVEPAYSEDELAREIWKPFPMPGFSHYEISNLGRARSLRSPFRLIKLSPQTAGYRQAPVVSDDGRKVFPSVHRLVAGAFLSSIPGKTEVNHKNGNKADNRVHNLDWLSAAENSHHSIASGLRHWRGVHHRAKITAEDVRAIRESLPSETNVLSAKYGISTTQINRVRERRAWTHI